MDISDNFWEFNFQCEHCDYKTNREKIFTAHKRFMHKDQTSTYKCNGSKNFKANRKNKVTFIREKRLNRGDKISLQLLKYNKSNESRSANSSEPNQDKILKNDLDHQNGVTNSSANERNRNSVGEENSNNSRSSAESLELIQNLESNVLSQWSVFHCKHCDLVTDSIGFLALHNKEMHEFPLNEALKGQMVLALKENSRINNVVKNDSEKITGEDFHKLSDGDSGKIADVESNKTTPHEINELPAGKGSKKMASACFRKISACDKMAANGFQKMITRSATAAASSGLDRKKLKPTSRDKNNSGRVGRRIISRQKKVQRELRSSFIKEEPEVESLKKLNSPQDKKRRRKKLHPTFSCDKCDYTTNNKNYFPLHQKRHKPRAKVSYNCDYCDYKSNLKQTLTSHKIRHHQDRIKIYHCDKCNFKTQRKHSLPWHQQRYHNPKRFNGSYSCEQCDYKSNFKNDITRHKKHLHEKRIKAYHCDKCNFKTDSKNYLPLHKQRHELQKKLKYSCEQCAYKSNFKQAVIRHKKMHHEKQIKVYHCDKCDFKTKYEHSLRRHQERHHHRKKFSRSQGQNQKFTAAGSSMDEILQQNGEASDFDHSKDSSEADVGSSQTSLSDRINFWKSVYRSKCGINTDVQESTADILKPRECNKAIVSTIEGRHSRGHKIETNPMLFCNQCTYQTQFERYLLRHQAREHPVENNIAEGVKITYNTENSEDIEVRVVKDINSDGVSPESSRKTKAARKEYPSDAMGNSLSSDEGPEDSVESFPSSNASMNFKFEDLDDDSVIPPECYSPDVAPYPPEFLITNLPATFMEDSLNNVEIQIQCGPSSNTGDDESCVTEAPENTCINSNEDCEQETSSVNNNSVVLHNSPLNEEPSLDGPVQICHNSNDESTISESFDVPGDLVRRPLCKISESFDAPEVPEYHCERSVEDISKKDVIPNNEFPANCCMSRNGLHSPENSDETVMKLPEDHLEIQVPNTSEEENEHKISGNYMKELVDNLMKISWKIHD